MRALSSDEGQRLKILKQTHPAYAERLDTWQVLLDAFEGAGGFLSGAYLWEYPREDSSDYKRRQRAARYHNYLESLVDLYCRFMFTQGVKRSSGSEDYNAWTENVDGAGTPLSDHLRQLASVALVHGHAASLIDKTTDGPTGPSKSDERARVVASVFTALSIPDWRWQDNALAAVKLLEAAPESALTSEPLTGDDAAQYLLWDREGWARFDAKGTLVSADTPGLGLVPLVFLRPKPSYTNPVLGRPLVSNANIIRAQFNRASEEDEVLQAQAFSTFVVEVPESGSVDQAKQDLGSTIGAAKAIFVRGRATFQTPDQNVPKSIRENIAYLTMEMFRAAHVRMERAGNSAESGESIRLQYTELNEMLQGFAKALSQAEKQIARCWFAWMSPTAQHAQAAFEAAAVEAQYPDEFFLDDLVTDIEAWAEAIRMDLGPTMTHRIKQKAVRRIDPDIPAEELDQIDKEIEAQVDDPAPVPGALDTGDPEAQMIAAAAGAMNAQ